MPGWTQIALIVLLVVLLFGRGKISDLMGDVAKGITSFRKGLKEEPEATKSADKEETKSVEDSRTIEAEVVSSKDKTDA